MDEPTAWLRVARAPGLHAGQLARLPATVDLAELLKAASRSDLASFGFGDMAVAALLDPDPAGISKDEAWLSQPGRRLVTWGSPDYPPLLAGIPDAPLVLFVEGDAGVLQLPQVAMVGSRSPTTIGRDTATQLATHLASRGLTITSGLALGIDAASHRGALQAGGTTVAVLGCGPDTIYPREHAALARQIATSGAVVSDLPTGVPPLKQHFPRRNRIISGLSVGTVVVEAALHSGSLITARLAGEQGREVFAIPGSIHNPLSRGCHKLIRQGARLVETADDIIAELGALLAALAPAGSVEAPETQGVFGPALDKEYEILLDALGFEPATVDALVVRTGFTADVVASMLLILELEGRVAQQHGGSYCRRLPGN